MSKAANTKVIGAFVLAATALIVAAIAIFGSGRFFRDSNKFVLYFRGSVQGLNVGSPVMFRGVPIGNVTNIKLLFEPNRTEILIPVFIETFPDRSEYMGTRPTHAAKYAQDLIDRGLRAQLVPTSLITGQLGVQLDIFPESPAQLVNADPDYVEIPTVPSTFEKLETTVQKLTRVIDQANLTGLTQNIEATMESIRILVSMPEIREFIISGTRSMQDIHRLVQNVSKEASPALRDLRQASSAAALALNDAKDAMPLIRADLGRLNSVLQNSETTVQHMNKVLQSVQTIIEPGSPLQYELTNALRELSLTARSVRSLSEALERRPNSVLFGKSTQTQ
jgi:paraquat-inducible protein B